ncbi:MAG: Arm DNA-binding domain-containing protein [Methylococcaceae bacterium]
MLVHSNGSKYFRYNYCFAGKRKTLALGIYPVTSLKEAREKRDTAKKQIDGGIDSGENRKAVKSSKAESAANSFEVITREWGLKKLMIGMIKITAESGCLRGIFFLVWVASL